MGLRRNGNKNGTGLRKGKVMATLLDISILILSILAWHVFNDGMAWAVEISLSSVHLGKMVQQPLDMGGHGGQT